jgi:septal ring-binding cell division protein DamX
MFMRCEKAWGGVIMQKEYGIVFAALLVIVSFREAYGAGNDAKEIDPSDELVAGSSMVGAESTRPYDRLKDKSRSAAQEEQGRKPQVTDTTNYEADSSEDYLVLESPEASSSASSAPVQQAQAAAAEAPALSNSGTLPAEGAEAQGGSNSALSSAPSTSSQAAAAAPVAPAATSSQAAAAAPVAPASTSSQAAAAAPVAPAASQPAAASQTAAVPSVNPKAGHHKKARAKSLPAAMQPTTDRVWYVKLKSIPLFDQPGGKKIMVLKKGDHFLFKTIRNDGWGEIEGRGWVKVHHTTQKPIGRLSSSF